MKMPKIKICGLSRIEDIQEANKLELDYIGFVFAKSKRQITVEQARELKVGLRKNIQVVGVFVNHSIKEMIELRNEGIIDVVQLHGTETEDIIVQIKNSNPSTKIIKAVSMTCVEDALKWNDSKVDYLLLDHGAGGTGEVFDWSLLEGLEAFKKPYFIAGGLNPENVADVLVYKPFGVDVSGGVETLGKKDCEKMRGFVEKVRN
ncbi:MAG: phosphoribosylanthranilate isomerase [Eubacteriales bacterium]